MQRYTKLPSQDEKYNAQMPTNTGRLTNINNYSEMKYITKHITCLNMFKYRDTPILLVHIVEELRA